MFFAILWMLVLFLPVSNLIPITHIAADRYMYASSVGFCMVLAFLVRNYVPRRWSIFVFFTVFVVFSVLTVQQGMVWKNNMTLWAHALKVNPNSARAVSNVGQLFHKDDSERMLDFQKRAASINPYEPFVQKKIGEIYEEMGDLDVSLEYYRKAQELFPRGRCKMYKDFCDDLKLKLNHKDAVE